MVADLSSYGALVHFSGEDDNWALGGHRTSLTTSLAEWNEIVKGPIGAFQRTVCGRKQ
jgi:hypothetical protein